MVEVEQLIAIQATEIVNGVAVTLKSPGGVEKAVAVTAEIVACGLFMIF